MKAWSLYVYCFVHNNFGEQTTRISAVLVSKSCSDFQVTDLEVGKWAEG